MYPPFPSGRMFVSSPLFKLVVEHVVACCVGFGCYHCSVVPGPSSYHRVELPDKLLLRDVSHTPQPFLDRVDVPFDGFFARCDEGFETKLSSMCVFPRLVFPYWVLSNMKA